MLGLRDSWSSLFRRKLRSPISSSWYGTSAMQYARSSHCVETRRYFQSSIACLEGSSSSEASAKGQHDGHGEGMKDVAILWDYENQSLPSDASSALIVEDITKIAQGYGKVTTFRAYLDLGQLASPKCVKTRTALHSKGISLIDCPHNDRKEVVDKAIIVDMYEFALDHSPPATVILISADGGYANCVSKLSLRGFSIIILAPAASHGTLRAAHIATIVDWPLKKASNVASSSTSKARLSIKNPIASPIKSDKSLPENFFEAAPIPVKGGRKRSKKSKKKTASPSVPTVFQPLVEVLRQQLNANLREISPSELGQLLAKRSPNVYKKLKVSSLKKYTSLALKANVIVSKQSKKGVVENHGNVLLSLHPRFL